ncbi:hypothetical protein B0H19DRAFT_1264712 [Mycena capillaripes]|nr:hypothetical protein B0H19DRAFT_1264712 [Mycena capillaripes]
MKIGELKARRDETYPVFTETNLDPQEVLNPATSHTRELATLLPHRKQVIVQRYDNTQGFLRDIKELSRLRHPNLPFLGGSTLTAPRPLLIVEHMDHPPAHEVLQKLQSNPSNILRRKAIEMITDILEGIYHLRKEKINISGGANLLGLQGPELSLQISLTPNMSSALWPVWQYWLGGRSDETIDIAASLLATGKLAYLDIFEPQSNHPVELGSVAYVQSGRLVVVGNILSELRDKGVVGVDDAFSDAHDDMKDEYGIGEIIQGNTRWEFPWEVDGSNSVPDFHDFRFIARSDGFKIAFSGSEILPELFKVAAGAKVLGQ